MLVHRNMMEISDWSVVITYLSWWVKSDVLKWKKPWDVLAMWWTTLQCKTTRHEKRMKKRQVKLFTFQAARPPQARVGHDLFVLLAGLILVGCLDLADTTWVQPVICAHGNGHEAERGKRAHCAQQHLHAAVKRAHAAALHDGGTPFPLHVQEINIGERRGADRVEKTGQVGAEGGGRRWTRREPYGCVWEITDQGRNLEKPLRLVLCFPLLLLLHNKTS